jgi:hypothetical protein
MARITEFHKIAGEGRRHPTEVDCGYRAFKIGEATYLNLETYGSAERKLTGKTSQSFQLDEQGAAYLMGILRRRFPRLK